ncbi:MAG: permease [Mariniblastus sp.]
MIEYFLAGGALRGAEVLMDAAIWIAFGCFIAAIFRNMLGPDKTRSLFGNQGRYGLLIGWGIGMLLPVCSLGVIPVVRELHRSGVKQGTIIAFGLTAPLFNPLSILYGLSLSDPIAIIVFSAAAMLIVTGLGVVWGKFISSESTTNKSPDEANIVAASGVRRSLAVIHGASTEMVSWSLVFIAIGVLVSAVTSVVFEHGTLQGETEPDNIFAPAFMACYVTPVYSTPLLAMSQIGGMFQHGNSIGAAFSLLILGAGINIGLLCWFGSAFGLKRVLTFMCLLLSMTLALAYAMDKPLYPKGVTPAGHTHAFDVYTHPFHKGQPGMWNAAWLGISERYEKSGGAYGLKLLGMLMLVGISFRIIETRWHLKSWLESQEEAPPSRWDIVLPAWVIGMVACIGLIFVSIFGAYLYYPGPASLLSDLSAINANCVLAAKTGDWEAVDKWVGYCDDLSRRLEVGVFLRTGNVSDFKRAKASAYREKLDELRDDIAAGQTSRTNEQAMELLQSYQRMSAAFREYPLSGVPSN